MEHFLINSTVCLFVLWLFYKLALENTSWHQFKRFYLLAAVVISLIIPFIIVKTVMITIEENMAFDTTNLSASETISEEAQFDISWFYIIMCLYAIGVAIMLWRFGRNLMTFKINTGDDLSHYSKYQLVLRSETVVPHSFFNRIFVSKTDYEKNAIPQAVFRHEKAHLDQKHSLDILLVECLIVVFWFNPLFYMYRYSMKLNHEFLADCCVIKQGVSTDKYQKLILGHACSNYQQSMANTFHFPIIKKRFNIMKTKTSTLNGLLRSLAIIPIITLLIFSCGQEETKFEIEEQTKPEEQELIIEEQLEVQSFEEAFGKKAIIILNNKTKGKVSINGQEYSFKKEQGEYQFLDGEGKPFDYKSKGYEVIEITEVIEDLTQEDIEEYNRLAKKHKAYMDENNSLIAWKDETTRMQTIFNSMNEEQRASNEPWPYIGKHNDVDYEAGQIPPPPPPVSELEVQEIDEVVEKSSIISPKMNSINVFISDEGDYFVNEKKVTEKDLISLLDKLGNNDYSNIYVFMFENDYKKFAMKRKPEDVYITVCAKNFEYDKNNELLKTNDAKGLKPLKLATEHKSTKEYALELAKTMKSVGIQNISI